MLTTAITGSPLHKQLFGVPASARSRNCIPKNLRLAITRLKLDKETGRPLEHVDCVYFLSDLARYSAGPSFLKTEVYPRAYWSISLVAVGRSAVVPDAIIAMIGVGRIYCVGAGRR